MSTMNRRELGKGLVAALGAAAVLPLDGRAQVPSMPSAPAVPGAPSAQQVQQVAEEAKSAKPQKKGKGKDAAPAATGPAAVPWTSVGNGIWKATIGTPEAFTPVKSRLVQPKLDALKAMPAVATAPAVPLTAEVTSRGTMLHLPLAEHEGVYGFGLQLLSFAQRGKKKVTRVNADPRGDSGDTHAPVPFYVTTAGYGIFVDTARYSSFYAGNEHAGPPKPTTDGAAAPTDMTVEIPRVQGADVYLFAGPEMLTAVRRYVLFSGGGVMPPEWGLGFWYRGDKDFSAEQAVALAKEFRDRGIPCDVFGLEPGWQTHSYSCTFVWDNKKFPDPAGFVKQLSDANFKLNLWEHSFTHPDSPLFSQLTAHCGDMAVWGGLVPDFAGDDGRKIFGDYHGKNLIDLGVSGFKLDECDNSDFTGGWSFPEFTKFPSGVDGEQMHSVFGMRYQEAVLAQYQQRNLETYGLVRSSGALSAPYPYVLYSDLYDHRQFIRALVNSGFTGLLWCPEVRDASSEEDLIRRMQAVMFSPLAMINAWYIVNPPWKQIDRAKNNMNTLGDDWEGLEAKCREIIGWRMQIVPYLRAAFAKYASDGTPPFRALVLDSPSDATVATVDDEWLVGDRMLVAPLFAGELGRKVTLPAGGGWHDFWTGAKVEGTTVQVPSSTENIPVYVKAGSVMPIARVTGSTAEPESRELSVQIYGDGSLPFSMATPKGETLELTWDPAKKAGAVKAAGATNAYKVTDWKAMG
jgi:alpha-D-xyloside xylohydrolase